MTWYNDNANVDKSKTLWGVAENFRFIRKWLKTAEEVQKLGGVKTFRVVVRNKVGTEGKYFSMSHSLCRSYSLQGHSSRRHANLV
jgi:hypothetical protein